MWLSGKVALNVLDVEINFQNAIFIREKTRYE